MCMLSPVVAKGKGKQGDRGHCSELGEDVMTYRSLLVHAMLGDCGLY